MATQIENLLAKDFRPIDSIDPKFTVRGGTRGHDLTIILNRIASKKFSIGHLYASRNYRRYNRARQHRLRLFLDLNNIPLSELESILLVSEESEFARSKQDIHDYVIDIRALQLRADAHQEFIDAEEFDRDSLEGAKTLEDINKLLTRGKLDSKCVGIFERADQFILAFEMPEHIMKPTSGRESYMVNNVWDEDVPYNGWDEETVGLAFKHGFKRSPLTYQLEVSPSAFGTGIDSVNLDVDKTEDINSSVPQISLETYETEGLLTRTEFSLLPDSRGCSFFHPHELGYGCRSDRVDRDITNFDACRGTFSSAIAGALKSNNLFGAMFHAEAFFKNVHIEDGHGSGLLKTMYTPEDINYVKPLPQIREQVQMVFTTAKNYNPVTGFAEVQEEVSSAA